MLHQFKTTLLITFLLHGFASGLPGKDTGSAIFIHPDGTGLGHWNALRLVETGPDGLLNWDRLEKLAAYRTHQRNWLTSTSHAGATVHAYGRKVHYDSYGMDRDQPLTALSGHPLSIMQEARAKGIRVGVVNSGHICEPGTAVFLASHESRNDELAITPKVLQSGADLIFSGGEVFMLPEGVVGQHGKEGRRKDGRNLIREAKAMGYSVIFTREELLQLDPETPRVLGVFAARNTYNDRSEAELKQRGLPYYNPDEPTFDEMVAVALELLSADPDKAFFLVAEEEGTDNFSNNENAGGMLEAARRADTAIGKALAVMDAQPERNITLIVGADSDANHPAIWSPKYRGGEISLPARSGTGAELDGPEGSGGKPFWSKPDAYGNRYPFGIAWAVGGDGQGSTVTKAHGFMSHRLKPSVDNTDVYKILYETLFGIRPWEENNGE